MGFLDDSNEMMYGESDVLINEALEVVVGAAEGDDTFTFCGIVTYDVVDSVSQQSHDSADIRLANFEAPHLFQYDITWPGGKNPIETLIEIKDKEDQILTSEYNLHD